MMGLLDNPPEDPGCYPQYVCPALLSRTPSSDEGAVNCNSPEAEHQSPSLIFTARLPRDSEETMLACQQQRLLQTKNAVLSSYHAPLPTQSIRAFSPLRNPFTSTVNTQQPFHHFPHPATTATILRQAKTGLLSPPTSFHQIDSPSPEAAEETLIPLIDQRKTIETTTSPVDVMSDTELETEVEDADDDDDNDDEKYYEREETADEKPRRLKDRSQSPHPDYLAEDFDENLPYAQLIQRALMSTPDRRMPLGEIYKYFRDKYERFRKAKGRGWMNSVRHNLSMNAAFLKEERPKGDNGKGCIWVLSKEAERRGVRSTTRYRKIQPGKKRHTQHGVVKRHRHLLPARRRKNTREAPAQSTGSLPIKEEVEDKDNFNTTLSEFIAKPLAPIGNFLPSPKQSQDDTECYTPYATTNSHSLTHVTMAGYQSFDGQQFYSFPQYATNGPLMCDEGEEAGELLEGPNTNMSYSFKENYTLLTAPETIPFELVSWTSNE